jgi:hypothetical protein
LAINPYTSVSITGYNSSPPPDDGSQTSANKVSWAKHKEKHSDPIKTLAESINTNAIAACNALALQDWFISTTSATIAETDWNGGYLQLATGAIYYPDPSTYENGWHHTVFNGSTGIVSLQATATSYWLTENGLASEVLLYPGQGVKPMNTATVWIAAGDPRAIAGDVIGTQYSFTTTCVTATEVIPFDGTLPFATEGSLALTLNHTSSRIGNLLRVRSGISCAPQVTTSISAAIFAGTASGAIAANGTNRGGTDTFDTLMIDTWVTSTATSSIAYTVRVGSNSGAHTLNGISSGVRLGSSVRSFIEIIEYRT